MSSFKPMRAAAFQEVKVIQYPVLVSPKYDGIRVAIDKDGRTMTRSLKEVPNKFIQQYFRDNAEILRYLDGELIVGDPTAPDCFKTTHSAVMSIEGEPDFQFYVFDHIEHPHEGFLSRYNRAYDAIQSVVDTGRAWIIAQKGVNDAAGLDHFIDYYIDAGYEGVMIRSENGIYKHGKCTPKEGHIIKYKVFEDTEATIIGFVEETQNNNEAVTNALGHTERSSHKENKVGKGSLGSFIVQSKEWSKPYGVGSGLDDATRREVWNNREAYIGKLIKFKYMPHGSSEAPRHPVFLGFRSELDLGE